MEKTIEAHLSRIKNHLATGRDVLRSLRADELTTYDVPDVTSDRTVLHLPPPRDTDKYSAFPLPTDVTDYFAQVLSSNRRARPRQCCLSRRSGRYRRF
jgi:hypothetical protein